jgi:two-component system chemotaxis sensor kinase CheA
MHYQADDLLHTIVHAGVGRFVGLVVHRILDIVEEPLVARVRGQRPGVLYTAAIQGRVTEVLDIDEILRPASNVGPAACLPQVTSDD